MKIQMTRFARPGKWAAAGPSGSAPGRRGRRPRGRGLEQALLMEQAGQADQPEPAAGAGRSWRRVKMMTGSESCRERPQWRPRDREKGQRSRAFDSEVAGRVMGCTFSSTSSRPQCTEAIRTGSGHINELARSHQDLAEVDAGPSGRGRLARRAMHLGLSEERERRAGSGRSARGRRPVRYAAPIAASSAAPPRRRPPSPRQPPACGLFRNIRACDAVVVVSGWPMLTRCSGQSKSIIVGMSWLRLMKK